MYNSRELGNLSDRDLLAESRSYEAHITTNAAGLNLATADSDAIKGVNNAYENSNDQKDLLAHQFDGAVVLNKTNRKNVLKELRRQRNVLYADTSLSDNDLALAGLPPRDKEQTASAAPANAPSGRVEYGKLKHTIYFKDSLSDSDAKPKGIMGCEIYHFIGSTAPTSEKDWEYLALDTSSPYIVYYEAEDANKKVFYQLRWVSKSGERGEWSEIIEATING